MSGKVLKYSLTQPNYDLFELDEATLALMQAEGGCLIKQGDAFATLHTNAKSFKLKLSETSNNLMVVADSEILNTT